MAQVLEQLDSKHIVVNNFKKANQIESYNKSKDLRDSIAKLAASYEEYTAANCTSARGNSARDVKLVNNWISKVRIVTQARLAFFSLSKTHALPCKNILESRNGCTFVKARKDGKFEVLSNDGAMREIKNGFKNERALKKGAEKKETAAKAKSERDTLSKMPEKPIERGTGKPVNPVLKRHCKRYFEIQAQRSGMSAEEYSKALHGVLGDIVSKLQSEGYEFVERVSGVITRLSNDEAKTYVAQSFAKNKPSWDDSENETKKSAFSEGDDDKIVTFLQSYHRKRIDEIPFGLLEKQLPNHNIDDIKSRAKVVAKLRNDKKEWSEEDSRIVYDAKVNFQENRVLPDYSALSFVLGRSEQAIEKHMRSVNFVDSRRVTEGDVNREILDNQEDAADYLDTANVKPSEALSETAREMGCIEHGYYEETGKGYSNGIAFVNRNGIKTSRGPRLHQAAATVFSGPRTEAARKRKLPVDDIDASHICGNPFCVNRKGHVKWESHNENMKRRNCIGYIRVKVGNKYIKYETKECTCDDRCLTYVTVG